VPPATAVALIEGSPKRQPGPVDVDELELGPIDIDDFLRSIDIMYQQQDEDEVEEEVVKVEETTPIVDDDDDDDDLVKKITKTLCQESNDTFEWGNRNENQHHHHQQQQQKKNKTTEVAQKEVITSSSSSSSRGECNKPLVQELTANNTFDSTEEIVFEGTYDDETGDVDVEEAIIQRQPLFPPLSEGPKKKMVENEEDTVRTSSLPCKPPRTPRKAEQPAEQQSALRTPKSPWINVVLEHEQQQQHRHEQPRFRLSPSFKEIVCKQSKAQTAAAAAASTRSPMSSNSRSTSDVFSEVSSLSGGDGIVKQYVEVFPIPTTAEDDVLFVDSNTPYKCTNRRFRSTQRRREQQQQKQQQKGMLIQPKTSYDDGDDDDDESTDSLTRNNVSVIDQKVLQQLVLPSSSSSSPADFESPYKMNDSAVDGCSSSGGGGGRPPSRCLILLMDPRRRIFEVVPVFIASLSTATTTPAAAAESTNTGSTTVGDLLAQVPYQATDYRLKFQEYTGITYQDGQHLRTSQELPSDLFLKYQSGGGGGDDEEKEEQDPQQQQHRPLLFAIPLHYTADQIDLFGSTLLKNPKVSRMIHDHQVLFGMT
jgi:hypothetical protein